MVDLQPHESEACKIFVKTSKLHKMEDVSRTDCFKGRVCCSWLGKYLWPNRYAIGKAVLDAIESAHDEEEAAQEPLDI